jgi:hypothetical protein
VRGVGHGWSWQVCIGLAIGVLAVVVGLKIVVDLQLVIFYCTQCYNDAYFLYGRQYRNFIEVGSPIWPTD